MVDTKTTPHVTTVSERRTQAPSFLKNPTYENMTAEGELGGKEKGLSVLNDGAELHRPSPQV